MPTAASRLRQQRRHREQMALAVKLGCSLAQAARLIAEQHIQRSRARRDIQRNPETAGAGDRPRFWWQDDR